MDYVHWDNERPELNDPLMIVAFEGWNDAGEAASTAGRHIRDRFQGDVFASIDPEIFYDFTQTRPDIAISEEVRKIKWPENTFSVTASNELGRDLIVMIGSEPQLRWRTYSEQIVAMADEFEVEYVISLGSLIADVVHSRPTPVFSTSHDPKLIAELNLEPSNYEGPTGIVGVIYNALHDAGYGLASLWAAVPGYAPHTTSPKAALALVQRVAKLIDTPIPSATLELAAEAYEQQISTLVREDEETLAYVNQLEEQYDTAMRPEHGVKLVEEVEEFLKGNE